MGELGSPVSVAEYAANRIRQYICQQQFKPGTVIGTEADLAAQFRVSRNSVRDAVGRLRGLGLVDSCQGKGVMVAQADPAETLGLVMPQYVIDHATLSELAALRCCLELGCVEMAVKHATDADIERLRTLGQQLAKAAPRDRQKAVELDIEFHKAILSATGKQLLKDMHHIVVAFFQRARHKLVGWYATREPETRAHAEIAEAFADRDAERARALLKAHFRRFLTPQKPQDGLGDDEDPMA